MKEKAFTLVELSIVLVILGLLTGGILAGQSLIRASELRAVMTEYQRYLTAAQAFRDRYFALPGDMNNATAVWGKDATNCNGNTGATGTPGTCNGNGDGMITAAGAASQPGEEFQFWKQLTLAGLLEGSYTGLAGPSGSGQDYVVGVNGPASKLSGGGWGLDWYGTIPVGNTVNPAIELGNHFVFGAQYATIVPMNPLLKPKEAWNLDTKLDDGKPFLGKIVGVWFSGSTTKCVVASSNTDWTATYDVANATPQCALKFPRQF